MLSAGGGTAAGVGITPLLTRCWPAICAVAAQVLRDGQIWHADVLAALGLTAATAPMGLSMIRSGSVPGSVTVTLTPSA